jgi:hypothetical protein
LADRTRTAWSAEGGLSTHSVENFELRDAARKVAARARRGRSPHGRPVARAGYRSAYWTLEVSNIVSRGELVTPAVVFAHVEYWEPSEPAEWLKSEIFPRVRTFFADHANHELRFGEDEDFLSLDDESFLTWLWLGPTPTLTLRHFREVLGLQHWVDVETWIRARPGNAPAWWPESRLREAAHRLFEQLPKG